jgi:enterochelin esterase-like enzyme
MPFPVSLFPPLTAVVSLTTVLLGFLFPLQPQALKAADVLYQHGVDSMLNPSNPRGTVTEHVVSGSKIFPGTARRYSLYVPAQYTPEQPAALMVFQDGHAFVSKRGDFRVPTVFDNLIARGAMPVTIAVMIDPGHKGELPDKRGWKPTPANRSVEYDTVSGDYANFLLEEVLPLIEADYRITQNPELRAICGNSSGGICAFSVAWHRPDRFRKVLSHIGSFVDLRGGHNYPPMIRKTDKKPIRVLLQDGENDLDNRHGNWPLANRQMARALSYQNYDYKLVFGDGGHDGKHAGTIFPDSLQWLWRGWKKQKP